MNVSTQKQGVVSKFYSVYLHRKPNHRFMSLPKTIDEVLEVLDEIIAESIQNQSASAYFAYVYRRTTAQIKAGIEDCFFEDNARMEIMDVYFANLYIEAYRTYKSGGEPSASWKLAFDAANDPLCIAQYIALGMNAHINLDLGAAAAHVSEGENLEDLSVDFQRVNTILFSLTKEMQAGLGKVSKVMFLIDWFSKNADEKLINFSIEKARVFSWKSAREIWSKPTEEERIVQLEKLDKAVAVIGGVMRNLPGFWLKWIVKIVRFFEVKEVGRVVAEMHTVQSKPLQ